MDLVGFVEKMAAHSGVTAVVGALVGGWFTVNASRKSHSLSTSASKVDRLKNTKNAISLLRLELVSAWSAYQEEYGSDLLKLKHDDSYISSWQVGQNPFVVYESIAACLTEITPSVAGAVVQFYMRMKGLIAMIEENNNYTALAKNSGLQKLDAMLAIQMEEGIEMTLERAEHHKEFLCAWIEFQATKIGMGPHANAMREFTEQLDRDLGMVLSGLDSEITSISKELSLLESHWVKRWWLKLANDRALIG